MSQEEVPQVYLKGNVCMNICSGGTEMGVHPPLPPLHCVSTLSPSSGNQWKAAIH